MKKQLLCTAVLMLLFAHSAAAYMGSFAVIPSIAGGPSHTTVTRFDIDTAASNPQTIVTNTYYVQSITIQTSTGEQGHVLIKEEPNDEQPQFSFTVQNKIQDVLVQATVNIWAPDMPSLTLTHIHNGAPDETITATKIIPIQQDANGNVLWQFTTASFSDFVLNLNALRTPRPFPVVPAVILALTSLSACILLRRQ